jgi:hypothetical protein
MVYPGCMVMAAVQRAVGSQCDRGSWHTDPRGDKCGCELSHNNRSDSVFNYYNYKTCSRHVVGGLKLKETDAIMTEMDTQATEAQTTLPQCTRQVGLRPSLARY